ncbi:hypothetical protein [Lutibacter flavus]|uniref:Uncharacterized protein n=1 Tax=Lutibacter flavus TaxID=691689 RepID=A0A238VKA2_9FLAO|nr:hypothetical protein [Lutibacter flavus]SNR34812.1 hypothetical protein SAMN04488111_0639 [Lutibacter flavus]
MRYLIILLSSILILSCTKNDNSELLIGTWKIDNNPENYSELKIEKDYILKLIYCENNIEIIKNKNRIENNLLIIDNQEYEPKIDTFSLINYSKDKITLNRKFLNQNYKLSKIENNITEIDSNDLENWKEKTIKEFKKRAKLYFKENNISEKKQRIDTIQIELPNIEEIEIPID